MTPRPDPGAAMTALTSASASSLASAPSPSPGAPYTEPLPRSYLLSSWLGVAWGVAHVALKAPTLHEGSIGLPLTLAWVVALVAARRGRRTPRAPRTLQTLPVAAALGIVGCYWLAAMHVGIEVPGTFYYWDQVAGAPRLLWNMAYAALMCVGIVLGLANVWTVRAALRRAHRAGPVWRGRGPPPARGRRPVARPGRARRDRGLARQMARGRRLRPHPGGAPRPSDPGSPGLMLSPSVAAAGVYARPLCCAWAWMANHGRYGAKKSLV